MSSGGRDGSVFFLLWAELLKLVPVFREVLGDPTVLFMVSAKHPCGDVQTILTTFLTGAN